MKRLDTSAAGFSEDFATLLAARGSDERSVAEPVRAILADVRSRGDEALCDYTARFDRLTLPAEKLRISAEEIASEAARVPADLMDALRTAARRIETFHAAQMPKDLDFTDEDGIRLGMRWTPLDAVGLYVPGGKAAYPSSVLMNALPARVAGVKRLAMCVPSPDGVLNPLVLAAAQLCGVEEIYRIGGAQAVGAMAFGTDLIAPVDRIVGPGNAYVAEAKRQVFGHVGIDSIAGPSEVVVVADGQNDPRLVALDLLAQAEHDEQAQAILITTDAAFAERAAEAVRKELETLPARPSPRKAGKTTARSSWCAHLRKLPRSSMPWPRASGSHARRPARLLGHDPSCRRDLHGPLLPRSRGRLCRWSEPRPADQPHGAFRLRSVGLRLHQAHHHHRSRRSRPAPHRPGRRGAGKGRRTGRPCAEPVSPAGKELISDQ